MGWEIRYMILFFLLLLITYNCIKYRLQDTLCLVGGVILF